MAPKNSPAESPSLPTSLEKMLEQAQVTRAIIVDDVFDPPTSAEISDTDVQEFAVLADNDDCRDEAAVYGLDLTGGAQPADALPRLWQSALSRKPSPLGRLAATELFSTRLKRKAELDALSAALRQQNIQVATFGALDDRVERRSAQLIFLDHQLDPPGAADRSNIGARAVAKIAQFKMPSNAMPSIVLISDNAVSGDQRKAVCRAVNQRGGFFGFIHKRDLQNANLLCLKLAELGVGLAAPRRNAIRRFTSEVANAIQQAAGELRDFLNSLELQDYVHLQHQKLDFDGEALGEYLQWMFEAKLGHAFSGQPAVAPARNELDGMSYSLLPVPAPASKSLLVAYHCAQTEAGLRPARGKTIISGRSVSLGDVFLHKSRKRVRMIVNPACDLVSSPFPKKRQPRKDGRVYFVEGVVRSMSDTEKAECVSEGVLIDDRPTKICWNLRTVTSVAYPQLRSTLKRAEFRFIFRFRPLFALAIQRQLLEHLGRIGLPTSPPYNETALVHIMIGDKVSNWKPVCPGLEHAAEIVKRDEIRLTVDAVSWITNELRAALRAIGGRADGDLSESEKLLKQRRSEIEACLESSAVWLPFVTSFRKPKQGQMAERIPDLYLTDTCKPDAQCRGPFSLLVQRSAE